MFYEIIYFLIPLMFLAVVFLTDIRHERSKSKYPKLTVLVFITLTATLLTGFLLRTAPEQLTSIAGFTIAFFGLIVGISAIQDMDEFFAMGIKIKPRHRLITTGTFNLVRHPIYLSAIIMLAGNLIMIGAPYILLMELVVVIPSFLIKIHYEEKVLIKHFGKQYLDYKKKVPKLIPYKIKF